jgi:hypothetical protein
MGTRWSKERHEQYRALHPVVERSEQRRLAQQRYRQRHAAKLALLGEVTNILRRQGEYPDDAKRLAAALRKLWPTGIKALRTELGRR